MAIMPNLKGVLMPLSETLNNEEVRKVQSPYRSLSAQAALDSLCELRKEYCFANGWDEVASFAEKQADGMFCATLCIKRI